MPDAAEAILGFAASVGQTQPNQPISSVPFRLSSPCIPLQPPHPPPVLLPFSPQDIHTNTGRQLRHRISAQSGSQRASGPGLGGTLRSSKACGGLRVVPSSMLMLWQARNCSGRHSLKTASSAMASPMTAWKCFAWRDSGSRQKRAALARLAWYEACTAAHQTFIGH